MHSRITDRAGRLGIGLNAAPVPAALWALADGEFHCVDMNEAGLEFVGRSRTHVAGATVSELGGNDARGKRDMLRALTTKSSVRRELPYVRPGGEVRQLETMYVAISDKEVLSFARDVTPQREVEQRLRVSEDRYRALVGAANEGVWLVDHDGRTTFANGKVGRILGRPLAEIAAANLLDFVDEQDRAVVAGALACPRDTPDAFEARFRHSDGHELLCLLSVSPMPGCAREATLCVFVDMTPLQRERDLRHQTEQRFQRMVETASEGVWTGDRDGRTTFVNKAAARMLGLAPEEVIGRPLSELVTEDADELREQVRRNCAPLRRELRLRRADGAVVDVIASISLLRDDGGRVVGSLAMVTDVSQPKREQAELRESRELFAQVFADAPVGMAFIGAGHRIRGQFLGANRALHELLGYNEQELLEHDLFSITHPDDVEAERVLAAALFEHERDGYEIDKRFIRADGTTVWARFRAHVLRDDRGAPLYGLGLAVDITAERAALERAAAAEVRARALLEATRDAVFEVAADGTIAHLNDAALLMFGFERSELTGAPLVVTLVPERLRARFTQALGDWLRDGNAGEPTETTMMRADGSEFPAGLRISAIELTGEQRLVLYVRNLSLQDASHAARREAEERFERLFRDGAVAAVAIDVQGRLADVNPAFCRLAGRDPAELVGRAAAKVLADAGDAYEPPWQSGAERPGPVKAARRIIRPDGSFVPVEISASLIRDASGAAFQWLCQCVPRTLGDAAPLAPVEPLSYRERQVLGLLARGLDGPAIGERLGLAPETVRSYANSAREKTGAKTRTQAVALALVMGEISL